MIIVLVPQADALVIIVAFFHNSEAMHGVSTHVVRHGPVFRTSPHSYLAHSVQPFLKWSLIRKQLVS